MGSTTTSISDVIENGEELLGINSRCQRFHPLQTRNNLHKVDIKTFFAGRNCVILIFIPVRIKRTNSKSSRSPTSGTRL